MGKTALSSLTLGLLLLAGTAVAHADADGVVRFATLPPGPGNPEGLTADTEGNIYVATFSFTATNVIHVFGPNGRLRTTTPLAGVPLGLAIGPDGNLYVADFGNGDVQQFALPLTPTSTPTAVFDVCTLVLFVDCGLNAIAFDAAGDLYVSDSFGGKIYKLDLPAGTSSVFVTDEQLKPAPAPHGFPPFGANGLAFSADGTALFIANTADDRILKLTLAGLTLTQLAQSINGADGVVFDGQGRLAVAANQQDEVVFLDPTTGAVLERRGKFEGIGPDGAPRGLLFPASLVLSRGSLYVTNAALALTPAAGDEPEEDVTTFTVSRIPLENHP